MKGPRGPLQGVKLVASSTARAGTVPCMRMAGRGADLIMLGVPDGGDTPHRPPKLSPVRSEQVHGAARDLVTPSRLMSGGLPI
jgi:crotonobetainyl-CoA:carnitine CoA-transferase CaiB-like acyl-CoA transferase